MVKRKIVTSNNTEEFSKQKFDIAVFLKQKLNRRKFKAHRMSIVTRKFIIFCMYLIAIGGIFIYGVTSPERITYTEDQLDTERKFENDTGEINMKSQTYSKENGIVLLEFETNDYTSSINKGISADNLRWQLRTLSNNKDMVMEVIPLTNNKIDVIIKNVPEDYNLLSVGVTNKTPSSKDVDVSIQQYDDYLSSSSEEKSGGIKGGLNRNIKKREEESEEKKSNSTYFLVTPQSALFKEKFIKNLSREKFALQIFRDELKFQKSQVKKLQSASKKLQSGIEENEKAIAELQTESQYLVGDQLADKQEDIKNLQDDIDKKNKDISTASDNITTVNATITQLEKNIQGVKDGSYQFSAPITSVTMEQSEVGKNN